MKKKEKIRKLNKKIWKKKEKKRKGKVKKKKEKELLWITVVIHSVLCVREQ
jgi:hypothetical protein